MIPQQSQKFEAWRAAALAKYEQIQAQKPVIVKPLKWFDRAVLSIKYPASQIYGAH